MQLLLLSNSTNPGEKYLEFAKNIIKDFLGKQKINILFIPYSAVTFSYDEYEEKVNQALKETGQQVKSIHKYSDPVKAVQNAEAIIIGGGNTWKLVKSLYDYGIMDELKEKIRSGIPYIGWSAGSNVACPTLRTTNDMPIVQPKSFETLGLINFQINPHYLDTNPEGHGGETREQRIQEFIVENKNTFVVGLREGTALLYKDEKLKLIGNKSARIFKYNFPEQELKDSDDFSFLQ